MTPPSFKVLAHLWVNLSSGIKSYYKKEKERFSPITLLTMPYKKKVNGKMFNIVVRWYSASVLSSIIAVHAKLEKNLM